MKKNYKRYKLPFMKGRNIGLVKRKRYRAIHFQIMMLLNEYKDSGGRINITPEIYKELFAKVEQLPEFWDVGEADKDYVVGKAIEFTIYKLFIAGNIMVGDILKTECLMRHTDLIDEARENKDFKAAISGNRDLMEALSIIKSKGTTDENSMFGVKLSQRQDGSKEAIMIGTGAECISAIRNALRTEVPKLEEKKNAI